VWALAVEFLVTDVALKCIQNKLIPVKCHDSISGVRRGTIPPVNNSSTRWTYKVVIHIPAPQAQPTPFWKY